MVERITTRETETVTETEKRLLVLRYFSDVLPIEIVTVDFHLLYQLPEAMTEALSTS